MNHTSLYRINAYDLPQLDCILEHYDDKQERIGFLQPSDFVIVFYTKLNCYGNQISYVLTRLGVGWVHSNYIEKVI